MKPRTLAITSAALGFAVAAGLFALLGSASVDSEATATVSLRPAASSPERPPQPPTVRPVLAAPPEPISPMDRLKRDVATLERRIATETENPGESSKQSELLSGAIARLKLPAIHVDKVQCFDTVCRGELSFSTTQDRDKSFRALLKTLESPYFAYVASADAREGLLFTARGERPLLDEETEPPEPGRPELPSQGATPPPSPAG